MGKNPQPIKYLEKQMIVSLDHKNIEFLISKNSFNTIEVKNKKLEKYQCNRFYKLLFNYESI